MKKDFDEEPDEDTDEEMPEYLTEDIRSQLAEILESDTEIHGLFSSDHISTRLNLLRDPVHSRSYTAVERCLLDQLSWSKEALVEIRPFAE